MCQRHRYGPCRRESVAGIRFSIANGLLYGNMYERVEEKKHSRVARLRPFRGVTENRHPLAVGKRTAKAYNVHALHTNRGENTFQSHS